MFKRNDMPPDTFLAILGAKVREARQERGWSQRKLAAESALRQATIVNIENAKTIPNIDTLIMIAGALDIPFIKLIPLPTEELAGEDEFPAWIREALKHMKYIEDTTNQKAIIAMLRTYADQEIKSAHKEQDDDMKQWLEDQQS